ncbi:hypothetical protein GCM10023347_11240 [Streptomyces chumphonensis]|uniref:AMP-binding protein n=1 Tax=Streptomyces chumphonensis TaxID=1214925 RepID=A0A927EZD9_9ACTN|nr:AMP-binding protein [Streptomyces chumphonensis]MBD3932785.1 AMP-binding protein [Streptomyces chumphonensis]
MNATTAGNAAAALADLCTRERWDGRPAFHEDDVSVTHGEVHALAARTATVLAERGVRQWSRVCLALTDGIAWVAAFLATARLGAVAVVTNPALTAADHAHLVRDSGPVLVVTREETADHFPGVPHLTPEALLEAAEGGEPAPAAPVGGDHPLYLQYTSGTTGSPKGVLHRHRDLERYHSGAGAQVLEIGPDDVLLSVSKLFFAYGLGNALAFPLCSGGAAVLEPGPPKPARIAELVARHGVTYLFAVPSAYANLLAETSPDAFRTVRAAVSAGERLTPELGERVTEFLGAPVYDQLGSTEAGHAIATNGPAAHTPGTVGRPVPGFAAEIRDKHGKPVQDGEAGELWVSGPTVTPGYHGLPEVTRATIVDGWLNTRDRAVRNPDGTLVHLGRTDDLEMIGGITVSPVEIERLLARHPAVLDVAVAGVPDDRGATKLRAFVVLRPGTADPQEEVAAALLATARAELAAFKVPRGVEVVSALPRTATGKIQRYLLRGGSW